MIYEYQYTDENDKIRLIQTHSNKYLIGEKVLFEGSFLVFTDVKPQEVILSELIQKMRSAELQINALDGKSEIIEGALVELASLVLE